MARTTPVFCRLKLLLKPTDKCNNNWPPLVSDNSTPLRHEVEFESSQIKRSLPTTKLTTRRVQDEIKLVCDQLTKLIVEAAHATEDYPMFEVPSPSSTSSCSSSLLPNSEPDVFFDLEKLLELRSVYAKLLRVSPALELVANNLKVLNDELTGLREKALKAYESLPNGGVKKVKNFPRVSNKDVDRLMLNYMLLTAVKTDDQYTEARLPLLCYWKIHRRLLYTQVKFMRAESKEEQTAIYGTKFNTFLQEIEEKSEKSTLHTLLKKVDILQAIESFQNYSIEEDPAFNPEIVQSQLAAGPLYFFAEIQRLLELSGGPQLDL